MKRIIKLLLVFASFILIQVSCSEDFLEPEPLSFFAPENVFVNETGFEAGLVTVRRDLKSEVYGNRQRLYSDHATSDYGVRHFLGNLNNITPSYTGHPRAPVRLLRDSYEYIKNTNVIISRIDDIEWSSQEKRNAVLGEALFYRSWWYYRLVNTYGDVPFVGEELTGAKLDFATHSRWTILEQLESDLEFATQWLPETSQIDQPNRYAAFFLLAKVYLSNNEFDKAIDAATSVINGPYSLMRERFGAWTWDWRRNVLWDLHWPENKAIAENTEAIFITIDRAEAPSAARTSGTYTMRNFTPTWWHSSWVRDSEGSHGTVAKWPDGSNSEMYDTLGRGNPDIVPAPYFGYDVWEELGYSWRNTPDLRRADINWIDTHELIYNDPSSVDYGTPIDRNNFAHLTDSLVTLFPFAWYKIWYPEEEGYGGHPYGGNGDRYIFRLAEMYLIRAEAYFYLNQPGNAASEINVVRERSNTGPITAADIDIDYIFDERYRELFLEEFRRTEMTRASYNMASLNKDGYSLTNFSENNWFYDRVMAVNKLYQEETIGNWVFIISPYHVLMPIDATIISANTMGIVNQNEGYVGAENNVPPLTVIE